MTFLLLPILMLSGRWPSEVRGRSTRACATSLIVGCLALVSLAIIFCGWYLFWQGRGVQSPVWFAAGITAFLWW